MSGDLAMILWATSFWIVKTINFGLGHFSKTILNKFEVNLAANYVWNKIGALDREIQEKKPWESKDKDIISGLVQKLYSIARMLNPLMPETSAKIKELIKVNKKPEVPLFLRK